MGDADDARFAPFLDEEGSPVLGESLADIIARDQIRRSEAVLERPLTDEQKEVIRSYYQETGHRRAPDEVSEQGTVHSLSSLEGVESPPRSNIASGGSGSSRNLDRESSPPSPSPSPLIVDPPVPHQTPSDETIITEHANEGAAAQLRDRIQAFEAQLAEAKQQRTSDQEQHAASQRLLDTACVDIARLQQEQRATEKRMATLESELNKTVKVELKKLRARRIREDADAEAEAEATTSLRRRQARNLECTQPHHIRLQRAGWSNLTAVTFAMVLLVWVVTEAMLHSKRLSDGYGPFINGGYNGLGSVVIFGTWGKFLLFILAMVYLGVLSVLAAMGW
ncbi:hypothetical protein C8A00DRAFT_33056 [Chaetomidium leptoderma]|uniref:Uncharacterized protein n=1 Tax=Chaetomidium leptoderma TaxID=669021 RepID=A0AAN6VMT8_9PEZI|nr:hypothetical protein C8A00DRAFT_33056 [Chaetomidium leptoderma]